MSSGQAACAYDLDIYEKLCEMFKERPRGRFGYYDFDEKHRDELMARARRENLPVR